MATVSARKAGAAARASSPVTTAPRSGKKPRTARVRLTHFEIKRGDKLRLRIAVADDALAEVGDELGALLKKIVPGTRTTIVEATPIGEVVSPQHQADDVPYHDNLREHLTTLFGSLCDTSLTDALEIAREERARRAEGRN